MTKVIITKFTKSDDQTNIDKYTNITEYHIISRLIFPRIIIPKFMMIIAICIICQTNQFSAIMYIVEIKVLNC